MAEVELGREQQRELDCYQTLIESRASAENLFAETDQDLRFFIMYRAYRDGRKPWEICGATDLENQDGTFDCECQLPKGHAGRWHQEWSKEGSLLAEWSGDSR
jgi:hypothetical protein